MLARRVGLGDNRASSVRFLILLFFARRSRLKAVRRRNVRDGVLGTYSFINIAHPVVFLLLVSFSAVLQT